MIEQVGGDHYKAEYQHWDWIADIQMPYHAACATKYITRHRDKNGDEDLQKAISYIDKCVELKIGSTGYDNYRDRPRTDVGAPFWRFVTSNKLTLTEAHAVWLVQEGEWEAARAVVVDLLNQTV